MIPAAERWITMAGETTRYREAGSGPPVVLVHGLGLSSDFWASHYGTLAASGLRAVAPDLPGFGHSDGPTFGLSVEETSEWLVDFADALALKRPAWIGHSLGAQPALDLAARYPRRAAGLVLVAPTGAPGRFRALSQIRGLAVDIAREPIALVPAVAREYVKTSPFRYIGTWLKAARDQPADKAPRIRCPTLILIGASDPIVPDHFIDLLRRGIADARVEHLSDGAHGVVFDPAPEFDRIVTDFLLHALH